MLRIEALTKRYDKKTIFEDINLDLPAPSVVGICGLNGSGKTTLLQVMAGLEAPTLGSASFIVDAGESRQPKSLSWAQQHNLIGFSGLPHYFVGNLQVRENIYYACKLRNLSDPRGRTEQVLLDHKLFPQAKQLAKKLSKGYAQRLSLALAMLHQPNLLILDEPFDGIDELQKIELKASLKQESQRALIIIASHDMTDLEALCDSVYVLHKQSLYATVPSRDKKLYQANFKTKVSQQTIAALQHRFSTRLLHEKSLIIDLSEPDLSENEDSCAEAALATLQALPDEALLEFKCLTQGLKEQALSIMSQ